MKKRETSSVRGKHVHSKFIVSYNENCKKLGCHPLTEIKICESNSTLNLMIDRLRVSDWPPLLKTLYEDVTLHCVKLRSNHNLCQYRDEIDSEAELRSMKKGPLAFTKFTMGCLTESLGRMIGTSKTLTCLMFRNLPLKSDVVNLLAKGVRKTRTLQHLSFQNCPLGDDGVISLTKAVKNQPSVITLEFIDCSFSKVGAYYIAELIKFQEIKRYEETWKQSLRYREIDNDIQPGLRRLTLNNNPSIGDTGLQYIIDILIDDYWIKAIDMQECGISNVGGKSVLQLVKANNGLLIFDIRKNDIYDNQLMQEIMDELSRNNQKDNESYLWFEPEVIEKKSTPSTSAFPASQTKLSILNRKGDNKSITSKHNGIGRTITPGLTHFIKTLQTLPLDGFTFTAGDIKKLRLPDSSNLVALKKKPFYPPSRVPLPPLKSLGPAPSNNQYPTPMKALHPMPTKSLYSVLKQSALSSGLRYLSGTHGEFPMFVPNKPGAFNLIKTSASQKVLTGRCLESKTPTIKKSLFDMEKHIPSNEIKSKTAVIKESINLLPNKFQSKHQITSNKNKSSESMKSSNKLQESSKTSIQKYNNAEDLSVTTLNKNKISNQIKSQISNLNGISISDPNKTKKPISRSSSCSSIKLQVHNDPVVDSRKTSATPLSKPLGTSMTKTSSRTSDKNLIADHGKTYTLNMKSPTTSTNKSVTSSQMNSPGRNSNRSLTSSQMNSPGRTSNRSLTSSLMNSPGKTSIRSLTSSQMNSPEKTFNRSLSSSEINSSGKTFNRSLTSVHKKCPLKNDASTADITPVCTKSPVPTSNNFLVSAPSKFSLPTLEVNPATAGNKIPASKSTKNVTYVQSVSPASTSHKKIISEQVKTSKSNKVPPVPTMPEDLNSNKSQKPAVAKSEVVVTNGLKKDLCQKLRSRLTNRVEGSPVQRAKSEQPIKNKKKEREHSLDRVEAKIRDKGGRGDEVNSQREAINSLSSNTEDKTELWRQKLISRLTGLST